MFRAPVARRLQPTQAAVGAVQLPTAARSGAFYTLADVPTARTYNFEQPTLTKKGRYTRRVGWAQNDEHFNAHMMSQYAALKKFDLTGVALSGGSIFSVLEDRKPNDLDFYFVSDKANASEEVATVEMQKVAQKLLTQIVDFTIAHATEQARLKFARIKKRNARGEEGDARKRRNADDDDDLEAGDDISAAEADALAAKIASSSTSSDPNPPTKAGFNRLKVTTVNAALNNLLAVRSGRVVTVVNIPTIDIPVQFTMIPYTLNDLVYGDSDVDVGAVAWTPANGRLHFGERSKFALSNFANVVHPELGISPQRLVALFDKGYDIILPQLDVSKLDIETARRVRLPFSFSLSNGDLLVNVDEIQGNRVFVDSIQYLPPSLRKQRPDPALGSAADAAPERTLWSKRSLAGVPESAVAASRGPIGVAMEDELGDSEGSAALRGRMKSARGEAIKASSHNVAELLEGGNYFKHVQTGREIVSLADPRVLPISDRTISSVLFNTTKRCKDALGHNDGDTMRCDAFLRALLPFFKPQEISAMTKDVFATPLPLRDRVAYKRHIEKVVEKWYEVKNAEGLHLLEKRREAHDKLSIMEQLGDKPRKTMLGGSLLYGKLQRPATVSA